MSTSDTSPRPDSPAVDPSPVTDSAAVPRLHVRTVALSHSVDLLNHCPADASAIWLTNGHGLVGKGVAWQVRTTGPDRFNKARAAFQELAANAVVDNEVAGEDAAGLVALGSFAYADASDRESILLVPQMLLGVGESGAFLTVISRDGEPQVPANWRDVFTGPPFMDAGQVEIEPEFTPQEYRDRVAEATELIARGQAEKVVLSGTMLARAHAGVLEPVTVTTRLAAMYPTCYSFMVGDVLGASPEMLAESTGGRVHSRVLAGTRPVATVRGVDTSEIAEQFLADPKERAEHQYAVDSVVERMKLIAQHVQAPSEPFVLHVPGLMHVASDVHGQLAQGVTSVDVAGVLHPSAAICGTPRETANTIIARLEERDRGGYAAPVGWMNAAGDGQWAIALRMAHVVDEHTMRLQAGGGIVAASDPVAEHAEVLAKNRAMVRALRGDAGADSADGS